MSRLYVHSAAAKLENALRVFQATFSTVDEQWSDAARREFQDLYLTPMEPQVKEMLAMIDRLATVFSAAENQCGSKYGSGDE